MQRRSFIKNTSLIGGLLALSPKDLLAHVLQQPTFKLTMLRNNVGIFTERGGTIAFHLSKDGITLVDSQYPDTSKHVIEEIKKQGAYPFKYLINTHHHADHTGGNISFKGMVEHVVGHVNCLANYQKVTAEKKDDDKQLMQDITFSKTWKQRVGDEKIKAYYFGAAHTNGDAIIHFEHANIAHMGDLMFNKVYPFIDKKAGASFTNWINVLDKAQKTFTDKTIFVFGHGSKMSVTGTKEDLKGMQNFIEKTLAFVGKEKRDGKSKEDVLLNTSIPDVGEWNDDFKMIKPCLEAAYMEI